MISRVLFLWTVFVLGLCYSDDCIYGEGVICRKYSSAVSCGKLHDCEDLWMHAETLHDTVSTGECKICEHFLKSQNYNIVSKILDRKKNMPDSTKIGILHSKLKNNRLVCALLQQCPDSDLILPTLRFNGSTPCEDCKKIILDVKVLINENSTKMAIATYLKAALCIHLPLQIVDVCKRSVDSYVGVIIDLALNEVDPENICSLVGLCENALKLNSSKKSDNSIDISFSWIQRPSTKGFEKWTSRLVMKSSPDCDECITVLSRIRNEAETPEFANLIRNEIKVACAPLRFLDTLCVSALSKRVSDFVTHADIRDLCTISNQCPGDRSAAIMAMISKFIRDEHRDYSLQRPTTTNEVPVICEFCVSLMHKILDATVNNRTEEAIMYTLEEICSIFPIEQKLKCREVIEEYGALIVDAVVSGTAPKVFCSLIGLCGPIADDDISSVSKTPFSTVAVSSGADPQTCLICESVVTFVYGKLEKNSTVDEIEETLKSVCAYIPAYKTQCEDLINAYTSELVKMFVDDVSPGRVCQFLKLCPEEKRDDVCQICQLVINFIYSKVEDNRTIERITEVLETACDHIPYWKAECKNLVDTYSSMLVKLLVDSVPAIEVCQTLNLCPSVVHIQRLCSGGPVAWCRDARTARLCSKTAFCRSISDHAPKPIHPTAPICSNLLTVEQRCSNARTAAFCGFSSQCTSYWVTGKEPSPLHASCSFCRRVLNKRITYGSAAVDCSLYLTSRKEKCEVIKSASFPKKPTFERINELCLILGMCQGEAGEELSQIDLTTPKRSHFLGNDSCTWGPSVFCRDWESAALCNRVSHCQQFVWRARLPKSVSSSSADIIPGSPLVDCTLPLEQLCSASYIRYCSPQIVQRCDNYLSGQKTTVVPEMPSESEEELKRRVCANPATGVCGDEKLVALCGFQAFCEAKGVSVVRPPSQHSNQIDCNRGNTVVCQSYQNAVHCGAVERCRTEVWMA